MMETDSKNSISALIVKMENEQNKIVVVKPGRSKPFYWYWKLINLLCLTWLWLGGFLLISGATTFLSYLSGIIFFLLPYSILYGMNSKFDNWHIIIDQILFDKEQEKVELIGHYLSADNMLREILLQPKIKMFRKSLSLSAFKRLPLVYKKPIIALFPVSVLTIFDPSFSRNAENNQVTVHGKMQQMVFDLRKSQIADHDVFKKIFAFRRPNNSELEAEKSKTIAEELSESYHKPSVCMKCWSVLHFLIFFVVSPVFFLLLDIYFGWRFYQIML